MGFHEVQGRLIFLVLLVITAILSAIYHVCTYPTDLPHVLSESGKDPTITQNLAETFQELKPAKILIVQHSHSDNSLHRASIDTHKTYAAHHGYDYLLDELNYVNTPRIYDSNYARGKEGTMNKIYLLRKVVQQELEKGDKGVDWILQVHSISLKRTLITNQLDRRGYPRY